MSLSGVVTLLRDVDGCITVRKIIHVECYLNVTLSPSADGIAARGAALQRPLNIIGARGELMNR